MWEQKAVRLRRDRTLARRQRDKPTAVDQRIRLMRTLERRRLKRMIADAARIRSELEKLGNLPTLVWSWIVEEGFGRNGRRGRVGVWRCWARAFRHATLEKVVSRFAVGRDGVSPKLRPALDGEELRSSKTPWWIHRVLVPSPGFDSPVPIQRPQQLLPSGCPSSVGLGEYPPTLLKHRCSRVLREVHIEPIIRIGPAITTLLQHVPNAP